MASDYGTYLAATILNEDRIVTYRLLSRALKVHVNIAKEMLFEFHQQQNRKKPGTVHASYLIAGKKLPADQPKAPFVESADGEAGYIASSPPFRSTPQAGAQESNGDIPTLSVTLVREGDLEQVRKNYESISSIHVYCLGPSLMKDPEALSDANREIVENYRDQDPLEAASTYGTVINKSVRRRAGHRVATSAPAAPAAPPPALKTTTSTLQAEPKTAVPETKPDPAVPSTSSAKSAKGFFGKAAPKGAAPAPKDTPAPRNTAVASREGSGGIFASFAKTKQAAVKQETVDISEDSPMKDVSDDEEETYVPPPSKPKKDVQEDRESRKAREAALMQMMEEDDEEEEPSLPAVPQDSPEEEEEEVESIAPNAPPTASQEPQEHMEVSGGRRRGRRRVMKKITMKDEEGYLVTKEEPSWESFSEDEPVIKPKAPVASSAGGSKSKKPPAKPGQGNIMAFFAKKS